MFEFVQKNTLVIKIILGAVALTFVGFGVGSYTAATDDAYLAKVGGEKIYKQDIERALNGQPADSAVRQQVLESLIRQKLLLADAGQHGMRVTDAELRRVIAGIPAFQDNGHFDSKRYEEYLQSQYMSAEQFQARIRDELMVQQQLSAFVDATFVSPGAVERVHKLLAEQRQINQYRLTAAQFLPGVKVDDADVQRFYDSNKARFQTPEKVRLEYVLLSLEELAKTVQVSEADVRKYYEEHKAELAGDEQRQVAHILIAVPKGASAADKARLKTEAEAIVKEVRSNPARFAALAQEKSADPGSAAKGGDLGWFGRGVMVKPFEDSAFKLAKGQVSDPVETEFGYHIIKVEGIKTPDLSTMQADIHARLARQKAGALYRQQLETLGDVSYQQSDSLKPVSEALKLPVQQTEWIVKGQPGSGIAANPKVDEAAFSDDVFKGKHNSEVIDLGNERSVVVRVAAAEAAKLQPLAEVAPVIRKELADKAARELAVKAGEKLLAELKAGKTPDVAWSAAQQVSRRDPAGLGRDVQRAVFSASVSKLPAYAGAAEGDGFTLVRIDRLLPAGALTGAERQQLVGMLAQLQTAADATSYLNGLRAAYPVTLKQMPAE
ncbi:SurA N-terminal domain-containing protein [Laribacter hongkongensis]|uniref:SurA N-terminal domain-containing protein n=1 Tax=Laribacter hongkongensis TaxID=168471 RepID=UPI0023D93F0B|nr:SurA N-terminal domain-containing protein [Laribacter hongkongensis]